MKREAMKYKAIIFDMDGTIVDTEHIWERASHQLIESRGITLTPEQKKELSHKIKGCRLPHSIKIIKEMVNLTEEIHELIEEKAQNAHDMYALGVRLIDGFHNFHAKTQQYKLKTGIATNANHQTLQITHKALNIEQ